MTAFFALALLQASPIAGRSSLLPFVFQVVAIFAIFYFVMIRPQQKQLKEHRALLGALKKGDEMVTQGGLVGRIHEVSERTVTLEIASGVRVRVLKTSIAGKFVITEAPVATKVEDKKEEK
jgi:preprotein translocase subunit YajC